MTLRISGFFRDAFPRRSSCSTAPSAPSAALDEADGRQSDRRAHARRGALLAARPAAGETTPRSGRLPRLRLEARRLRRRPAGADRRGLWADAPISPTPTSPGAATPMARARRRRARRARLFAARLTAIEAVVHNQDNREHDLLDQRRLLPVRRRPGARRSRSAVGERAARLPQRPFAPRAAGHPHARGGDRPRRARRASSIRNGSPA